MAFDAQAVAKIFAAKGRPANNPLIVHLPGLPVDELGSTATWPAAASRLAARFWPGPLTLVLPKPTSLPVIVTGGGPTWAVRVPDHAVTHALLVASGWLAAPSANTSNTVSPTTAEHVLASLDGKIDLVLDGGRCPGGIESTVLDLTSSPPRLLRPGPIRPSELADVIGEVAAPQVRLEPTHTPLPSPGTSIRHYAPRATLECYADPTAACERVARLAGSANRVAWLRRSTVALEPPRLACEYQMPVDPARYASCLYDALHAADQRGDEYIVLDLPPDTEEWLAVRDRLRRAASVWEE
jgi:L-threonylcarbamoyladenylate synthase